MRIGLVLLVVLVVATLSVDSFRFRGRRFWRRVKRVATTIAVAKTVGAVLAGGKRGKLVYQDVTNDMTKYK